MFQSVEVAETETHTQIGLSINRHHESRDLGAIGVRVAFSSCNRKHTKMWLGTKESVSHTNQKVQKLPI